MSDKTHGVVFEATQKDAVDFFQSLNHSTFLRLTALDSNGLWGIYTEGWPGDQKTLDEIALSASLVLNTSLRYRYVDDAGSLCDLFENGLRTRSQDPDDPSVPRFSGDVFKAFGRTRALHDVVEVAFAWGGNEDWLLENDWNQNR
ncbi:MAG: hypothetical protein ABGZ35_22090 [Planctomycetaceae bacterium]|jgi:hypothetical protein